MTQIPNCRHDENAAAAHKGIAHPRWMLGVLSRNLLKKSQARENTYDQRVAHAIESSSAETS
eukprot:5924679-Amphidinium_carterae.2